MKYTKAFGIELLTDIKKVVKAIEFSVQGIYVAYLIYAMFISFGHWTIWVNAILLAVSLAYLVFTVVMELEKSKKFDESIKKSAKKLYSLAKRIIHIPTIISAIITLTTLESDNITISLLITLAVIFSYVVYISSLIIEKVATTRVNRLLVALDADMESMFAVVNKFRRLAGDGALSFGGNDENGEIRSRLEKIATENQAVSDEQKAIKKQQRAENRKAFMKEDAEKIKSAIKSTFSKAKSKLTSLTKKEQSAIAAPSSPENKKSPAEKQ